MKYTAIRSTLPLIFLTGFLWQAAFCMAAPVTVPYVAGFEEAKELAWGVMSNQQGKLTASLKTMPEEKQHLSVTATGNAQGSVGVSLQIPERIGTQDYQVLYITRRHELTGQVSVNFKCLDKSGQQIGWVNMGELPEGPNFSRRLRVASFPQGTRTVEILLAFEKAEGTVQMRNIAVRPLHMNPTNLAKFRPKNPTKWATAGLDSAKGMPVFPPRMRDTALKLMVCAGITNCREVLDWREVEKARGKLDLSGFSKRLDELAEYGISVPIVCLNGTPEWVSGKNGQKDLTEEQKKENPASVNGAYWPPRDWTRWESFVTAAVKAGKGKVAAWEILNEPDLQSAGYNGTYNHYREYLRRAYTVVKAEDPSSRVFTAAFAQGDWLPRLLDDGYWKYFDGVSTHPYGKRAEECITRNRATHLLLLAANQPKETWITEVGFQGSARGTGAATTGDAGDKAQQGRIALSGLQEQAELITWNSGNERGNTFGLNRVEPNNSLRPMPMYFEIGDLSGRLRHDGGPIRVEVKSGGNGTILLSAKNTTANALPVKLWPVGFVAALGPQNEGPRSQDWEGMLAAGETKRITVRLHPAKEASDTYAVGLAAICSEGNTLLMIDYRPLK